MYALEATFSVRLSLNLVRMFVLMNSEMFLKMDQVRSKTRLVGQILEKPCVRSRGHISSQIAVKLSQDICLDVILDEFENRLCRVKN